MYRKRDREQLTLDAFVLPFGGKLRSDNHWVKLAEIMPWDFIEDIYTESMSTDRGAGAISARIAFGALFIKEYENFTDERTVEHIAANPYFQYFLGLKEFQLEPLFDPSMMVHFRKRFPADKMEEINKHMFIATKSQDDNDDKPPPNKGKMVLDATCAPADIRYPSDVSLLNEARENTEQMIEELWEGSDLKGHKTRYSRKKARNQYLSIAKQKKPKASKSWSVIGKQLGYIKSNIETIGTLLMQQGLDALPDKRLIRLMTICELYRQQNAMYESHTHKCEDRIVSLRQPDIRPIVRGKAGKRFEFGQKIAVSVVNGYTFIERQSFNNFNEGITLIASAERYKQNHGSYPEAIQADQIYRTRKNRAYCKERGIRLSGPKLGRPSKDSDYDKAIEYRDNCERNIVEGRNGMVKRRFGLDLIMAYLPETALTEAALNVLCMNVRIRRFLRCFLRFPLFCFPREIPTT